MLLPGQVRMARAALGWSLAELARRAEVNPNTISRYETGREVLSGILQKLEAVLRAEGIVFLEDAAEIGVKLPKGKMR